MPTRAVALGLVLATLLTACAPAPVHNPLATWVPSPNHNARRAALIVLHATETGSITDALAVLRTRNSGGPVSAHYLIGRDGPIYQLVADSERAWQAGAGQWNALTDLNSASIGIELNNREGESFPPAQIASLQRLLADLTTRLGIAPVNVIAHADLAPTRRRDPGPLFPWAQLAAAGYGLWPRAPLIEPPDDFNPWAALRLIGYGLTDTHATVRAFHLHYRGRASAALALILDEVDRQILYNLARQRAPRAVVNPGAVCCDDQP